MGAYLNWRKSPASNRKDEGSSPSAPAKQRLTVMDYKKHYQKLIKKARKRNLNSYTERHHILPKCLGGSDSRNNLVELTPEEHYVAHQLLVKIYGNVPGLIYSAILMATYSKYNHQRINNKLYGWLKRRYSNVCKARVGEKNGSYGKSWYYNPKTLENGKFIPGTEPKNWVKGRKIKKECIKKWFYDPITLENGMFLKEEVPNGWISGKKPKTKQRKNKTKNTPKSKTTQKIKRDKQYLFCNICGHKVEKKKKSKKYCLQFRYNGSSKKKKKEFLDNKDKFLYLIDSGKSFSASLKEIGYNSYTLKNGVGKWAKELLQSR